MKKLIFILLIIFSSIAYGSPRLLIQFSEPTVHQGSIVKARLSLDADSFQQLDVQKLKGQTLAETLYLHSIDSFIRRTGEGWLDADAYVIFVKAPEGKQLLHKNGQSEIQVIISDIEVIPTETPQQFIFGDFSAPGNKKYLFWIMLFAGLVAVSLVSFAVFRKIKKKRLIKQTRMALKNELLEVKTFEDAVGVWQKKQIYLKEFPSLEPGFLSFQNVLFKSLFKPKQSETEKLEVINAYKSVSQSVQELKDGV